MLPIAVTIHDLEEAVWFPAWSLSAGAWQGPVDPGQFRVAVAMFTGLVWVVTYASVRGGRESLGAYLMSGTALTMLLNVFFPHLGATVFQRAYAPGVVTAVLLNLPVTLYLLRRAFEERHVSKTRFAVAAVTLPGIYAILIVPLLLFVGGLVAGAFV